MGPITGYGIYNGGYPAAYSSTVSNRTVYDYDSAATYLGKKYDRPLGYATRIWRVTRYGRELVGARNGIAIYHHGTPIIVWRRDGLIEFLAYNSVTTKHRLNTFLPISVYSERGQLSAYQPYGTKNVPLTPRRIAKCRSCTKGRYARDYCGGYYHDTNDCGRRSYHRRHPYYGPETREHGYVTCSECKGLGARDYGSRPIPFALEHGNWYLLTDGRVTAHYGRGSRWTETEAPKPPVKIDRRRRRGEIIAYRAWSVDNAGLLLPLGIGGAGYETFNLPPAECRASAYHGIGDVPAPGCTCGYWSLKRPGDVPSAQVYGQVRLWGRYSEHRIGYRAERMAIDYLVTKSEIIAAALVTRYKDVPVYVGDWPLDVSSAEPYALHETVEEDACI